MAWTPEQKKAASDRAKARHAAQKQKSPETETKDTQVTRADEIEDDIINAAELRDPMFGPQPEQSPALPIPDYGDIQRMVDEMVQERLKQLQNVPQANYNPWAQQQQPGLQIGGTGALVGVREKYIVNPQNYPDPRERLAKEARLQRFAFKENYDLDWEIGISQYQTKDGVNTREPKFTLKLVRVVFDDDTGLATNQRYVVCQIIFHEDPEAALAIAREQGYEVSDYAEKDFLDEMRYLRMRDWLLEAFYPQKPTVNSSKKEMVIGNRVVQVFEINAESAQPIPFSQLDSKKKL